MIMLLVNEDGEAEVESPKDYQHFFENTDFIHYIGMMYPPKTAVSDCISMLENTHYKPDTDRNHLFVMRVLDWQDIKWMIVSIPFGEKVNMETIAQEHGLYATNNIPDIFTGDEVHSFPVSNDRVFTLKNIPNHSS